MFFQLLMYICEYNYDQIILAMRKKAIHALKRILICVLFLFIQQSARSQVPNPSTWESFVRSAGNSLVTDTFRMQTFAKLPTDNWAYTSKGNVSIVQTSQMNIGGIYGKYSLRIPMDTEVAFEHYPLAPYKDISINVHVGGRDRKKEDHLLVRTYRPGDPEYTTLVECKEDGERCTFEKSVRISKNPPGIDLVTRKPATYSTDSRYCLDSIYAYGNIPRYTLFSGSGNWNDTLCWSHLPAARHRKALINGDLSIDSEICCDQLRIGNGSVRILPTGCLRVNNLTLYPDDTNPNASTNGSLLSSGTVEIQGTVSVEKTFARKGQWYFISFPFDVYPEGIDPAFQLGDEQSDTQGNYFYLKTYNGERRATLASASGNWTTIPRTALHTNEPLLQRGKGYLIALDAKADRSDLCFNSSPHMSPADFGKNGTSPITVTINTASENQNHNGWYLCGNPLPSTLPLNQLKPNEALDGFIYLYDGTTYQAYAIGSDIALPPFSAFFVKATGDTELSIQGISVNREQRVLISRNPLSTLLTEPGSSTVSNNRTPEPSPLHFHITGKVLHIGNIRSPGYIHIFNINGSPVYTSPISPEVSDIQLSLPPGFYISQVQFGQNQERYKFILP